MDIEYATLGASAASNAGASEGTEVAKRFCKYSNLIH